MAYNQQLSVLGQVAPATTGTAGQVLVSAGMLAALVVLVSSLLKKTTNKY